MSYFPSKTFSFVIVIVILAVLVNWLGYDNTKQLGSNIGNGLVWATGGRDPSYGLTTRVAVPNCGDGWSDVAEVPVGKGFLYDGNVKLVAEINEYGTWKVIRGHNAIGNQLRFCTTQAAPDAYASIIWHNL